MIIYKKHLFVVAVVKCQFIPFVIISVKKQTTNSLEESTNRNRPCLTPQNDARNV